MFRSRVFKNGIEPYRMEWHGMIESFRVTVQGMRPMKDYNVNKKADSFILIRNPKIDE